MRSMPLARRAFACALLLAACLAHAQAQKAFPYYVEWETVDGAGGYRVEVRDSAEKPILSLDRETSATDCKIELPPGRYAFRVVTLNKFLRDENATDWIAFTIDAYTAPAISKISPTRIPIDAPIAVTLTASRVSSSVTAWLVSPTDKKIPLSVVKKRNGTFALSGPALTERGSYALVLTNPPNLSTKKADALFAQYPDPVVTACALSPSGLNPDAEARVTIEGRGFSPEASVALAAKRTPNDQIPADISEKSPTTLQASVTGALPPGEYLVYVINEPQAAKIQAGKITIPQTVAVSAPAQAQDKKPAVEPTPAPAKNDGKDKQAQQAADSNAPAAQTPREPLRTSVSFGGGVNLNLCLGQWQRIYPGSTASGFAFGEFRFADSAPPPKDPRLDFSAGLRADLFHQQRDRDSSFVNSAMDAVSALAYPAVSLSFRHFRAKAYIGVGLARTSLSAGTPDATASTELSSVDPAYGCGIALEYPIMDFLSVAITNQFLILQNETPIMLYSGSVGVSLYFPLGKTPNK